MKSISCLILSILLVGVLISVLEIQPANAVGVVYIRADGSIDPPDAPIVRDGDVYTLTGNLTSDGKGIIIERDNMTFDGSGYTLHGTNVLNLMDPHGIILIGRKNVTITNTRLVGFAYAILLESSPRNKLYKNTLIGNSAGMYLFKSGSNSIFNNTALSNYDTGIYLTHNSGGNIVSRNTIKQNTEGILLHHSYENTLFENTIVKNYYGVRCDAPFNNFYHNNFINNTRQVKIEKAAVIPIDPTNAWNNSREGNYWSNYTGADSNNDGIGDTVYVVGVFNNVDYYPLMSPYIPPPVSISPRSVTLNVGQSQLFASNVSEGTPPFSYQWHLNGNPVAGFNDPTWTFTPTSPGSHSVYLNVTDSASKTMKSNVASVTVNPALSVTISPGLATTNIGQSQLFTSSVTGGASPYSCQWYLNSAQVSGATLDYWMFTPSSPGSYTVYLRVTDGASASADSNIADITVNPQLTVSISPSDATIHVNGVVTFTSTVLGGTTPRFCQWYLNGDPVPASTYPEWTFNPTNTGTYYVHLNVTDSAGSTVSSNLAPVTVSPPVGGVSASIADLGLLALWVGTVLLVATAVLLKEFTAKRK